MYGTTYALAIMLVYAGLKTGPVPDPESLANFTPEIKDHTLPGRTNKPTWMVLTNSYS